MTIGETRRTDPVPEDRLDDLVGGSDRPAQRAGDLADTDPAAVADFEGVGLFTGAFDFDADSDFRSVQASILDDASGDGSVDTRFCGGGQLDSGTGTGLVRSILKGDGSRECK